MFAPSCTTKGNGKWDASGNIYVRFNTCDGEGCKIMQPPLGSKPALTKGVELGTAFHVIKFPPRFKTQAPPFPSSFAPDPIFHLLHDSTIYPPSPFPPPLFHRRASNLPLLLLLPPLSCNAAEGAISRHSCIDGPAPHCNQGETASYPHGRGRMRVGGLISTS